MHIHIVHPDPALEYAFVEGCSILECWNDPDDPQASIARARVAPGVTTRWHALVGVTERYLIVSGTGQVDIGDAAPAAVRAGDVVVIPAGVRQRIGNTGTDDLLFYAICTPRFTPACYAAADRAPKLVLHPEAATLAPADDALIQALQALGLIGSRFTLDGQTHFHTGPNFLDGISFLGCAPAIQLDPPAASADREADARAGRFCHIQLHAATDRPRLRHTLGQRPRCRQCRSEIPPAAIQPQVTCPACGHSAPPAGLNWRQAGGHARLFLDIWGIHAAEAVPSDRLLDRLAQASGGPWQFFYIED